LEVTDMREPSDADPPRPETGPPPGAEEIADFLGALRRHAQAGYLEDEHDAIVAGRDALVARLMAAEGRSGDGGR